MLFVICSKLSVCPVYVALLIMILIDGRFRRNMPLPPLLLLRGAQGGVAQR